MTTNALPWWGRFVRQLELRAFRFVRRLFRRRGADLRSIPPHRILDGDILAERYRVWLANGWPTLAKAFADRLKNDPGAARFEAVTWWLLTEHFRRPVEPGESEDDGGPDFRILDGPGGALVAVVECTNLQTEELADRSGVPSGAPSWSGQVEPLQDLMLLIARRKAPQLEGHPVPRFLFIGSDHTWADFFLFDDTTVTGLLSGGDYLRLTRTAEGATADVATNLGGAAFFYFDADGHVVARRKSISAIVLVTWGRGEATMRSALHPDPAHPASSALLPCVPFARLKTWPVVSALEIEWTIADPAALRIEVAELLD